MISAVDLLVQYHKRYACAVAYLGCVVPVEKSVKECFAFDEQSMHVRFHQLHKGTNGRMPGQAA